MKEKLYLNGMGLCSDGGHPNNNGLYYGFGRHYSGSSSNQSIACFITEKDKLSHWAKLFFKKGKLTRKGKDELVVQINNLIDLAVESGIDRSKISVGLPYIFERKFIKINGKKVRIKKRKAKRKYGVLGDNLNRGFYKVPQINELTFDQIWGTKK